VRIEVVVVVLVKKNATKKTSISSVLKAKTTDHTKITPKTSIY
jgi:hypothetical protein